MLNLSFYKDRFSRGNYSKHHDIEFIEMTIIKERRILIPYQTDFITGKSLFLKKAIEIKIIYNVLMGYQDYDEECNHCMHANIFFRPAQYTALILNT